jgi:hypothetical protein
MGGSPVARGDNGCSNNPPPEYTWCVGCIALGWHRTQSSPDACIAGKATVYRVWGAGIFMCRTLWECILTWGQETRRIKRAALMTWGNDEVQR